MVSKYNYWIVLYIVHVTAFCLGGGAFCPDTVYITAFSYGGPSPSDISAVSEATKHRRWSFLSQPQFPCDRRFSCISRVRVRI